MKTGKSSWHDLPALTRGLTWRSGGRERHLVFGVVDGAAGQRSASPGFVARNFGVNLVFSGRGTYEDWRGTAHPLARGLLYVRRPGLATSLRLDPAEPWREWFFTLDPSTFAELESCGLVDVPGGVLCASLPEGLARAWRDLRRRLDQPAPPAGPELLHELVGWLREAAVAGARSGGAARGAAAGVEARLAEAARRLEQDFAGRLDLDALAAAVGLGRETFRKRFRAAYRVSPGQYRIARRLELAKALLAQDSLRVKQIAAALGYADAYAFSAQFRSHTGRSPRAHRARTAR